MLGFRKIVPGLLTVFAFEGFAQQNSDWNSAPSTYNFSQLEANWVLRSGNTNELDIRAGVNFAYITDLFPIAKYNTTKCILRFNESKYDRVLPAASDFKIKAVKNSATIEAYRNMFLQPFRNAESIVDKKTKLTYLELENHELGDVQLTCHEVVFTFSGSGDNHKQALEMYPLSLHTLSCAFYAWMKKPADFDPNATQKNVSSTNKPLVCPTGTGKVKGVFYSLNTVSGVYADNQYFEVLLKGDDKK